MSTPRMSMALTGYGLPHSIGMLATKSGERHPRPIGPIELMDLAVELGYAGVEMPVPRPEVMVPERFKEELERRSLHFVADYMALADSEAEAIRAYLKTAAAVGAKVVRSVFSRVLCGDRRPLAEGWDARLAATAERLKETLPCAHDLGLCIAMENHQDANTRDFLRLAEMVNHHPAYGITLDTGNPLAVGEGPVEAACELAPLIRHVHMKDYTIHFAPEGYRLVRCAAGDGVVDFAAILQIVRNNGHDVLPGNEIAAQPTRTIPMLEDGWWACYPPTEATNLLPALRILWAKGRPVDEAYSSAWERGEDSATVSAEEMDLVRRSTTYFRTLVEPEEFGR